MRRGFRRRTGRARGELATVGLRTASRLSEHLRASGLGQLAHLGVNALAVGRDAGIAVFHAAIMAVTYAKEKCFAFSGVISLHKS